MIKAKDILIIFLGAIIFSFLLVKLFPQQTSNIIISPLADSIDTANNIINSFKNRELTQVVENSLKGTRGTYGLVIKNLRTGETYTQHEDRKFESASLYKLWVMGTAYYQIKNGTLSPDDVLSQDVKELNRIFKIDDELAEKNEGTIEGRVDNLLEKMITISDNYSALLLTSKIRNSNISSFMRAQGYEDSKLGQPPLTTPRDIAIFYEQLFNKTLIDETSSEQMLELLKKQRLNDRIPKYLPNNVSIAHKTGELDSFKHDAGIIYGKDPILFIALSESNSQAGAAERIAILARDVYQYFENK